MNRDEPRVRVERHDVIELSLAEALYRDVRDVVLQAARFSAIEDFLE